LIPGLPSMGGMEILIVLAIILLFFGAKRVPELGRSLGRGIREFRQGTAGVGNDADKDQVRDGDSDGEKPSLTGAAHGGLPHSTEEAETTYSAKRNSS
jgi:sec-independent protein translocase protein TatA